MIPRLRVLNAVPDPATRLLRMVADGMPEAIATRVLERIEGAEALGPAPRCVCAKCHAEGRK